MNVNLPLETFTVYLLKCNDETMYTGCTSNLSQRMKAHSDGKVKYTATRLPLSVITTIQFCDKYKAFQFKKYLKSGSGKAFSNKRLI